jgi:hypothetical protein
VHTGVLPVRRCHPADEVGSTEEHASGGNAQSPGRGSSGSWLDWYVLSARRADVLLRRLLFERVYAVRVRAFARNYPNAELDMHFSLSQDLTPLREFLGVLRRDGLHKMLGLLERGDI